MYTLLLSLLYPLSLCFSLPSLILLVLLRHVLFSPLRIYLLQLYPRHENCRSAYLETAGGFLKNALAPPAFLVNPGGPGTRASVRGESVSDLENARYPAYPRSGARLVGIDIRAYIVRVQHPRMHVYIRVCICADTTLLLRVSSR